MKKSNIGGVEYFDIPYLKEYQNEMLRLLNIIHIICLDNKLNYWLDGGTLLGQIRHNGYIPWDDDLDICLLKPDYDKLMNLLVEYSHNDESTIVFYANSKYLNWCDYFGSTKMAKNISGEKSPCRVDIFPVKLVENIESEIDKDRLLTDTAGCYILGRTKFHPSLLNQLKNENRYNKKSKNDFLEYYNNSYMLQNYSVLDRKDFLLKKGHGNFSPIEFSNYSDVFPIQFSIFEGIEVMTPNNIDAYLRKSYKNYMELPPIDKRKPLNDKLLIVNDNYELVRKRLNKVLLEHDNVFLGQSIIGICRKYVFYFLNFQFKRIAEDLYSRIMNLIGRVIRKS